MASGRRDDYELAKLVRRRGWTRMNNADLLRNGRGSRMANKSSTERTTLESARTQNSSVKLFSRMQQSCPVGPILRIWVGRHGCINGSSRYQARPAQEKIDWEKENVGKVWNL